MDSAAATIERDAGMAAGPATHGRAARDRKAPVRPVMRPWLRNQSINVTRHAAALRPFKREEFGTGAAVPSEGHIQAVNSLMQSLRKGLLANTGQVTEAMRSASSEPSPRRLTVAMERKDRAHRWVQGIERIWDFYFELFGQRQSIYADWLLSCDRIAVDCYQAAYMGLGKARPIPAPPPFCYMRTGFAPATFRRGIPLRRLGRQLNPFPLVQLPYHRLINPWTLGAMLHETSHNLQSDLGLSRDVPRNVARRLLKAGLPPAVAKVWARWNREMFSDMSALLLGGPQMIASLMDVVGRAPAVVFAYNPQGPHPTPYLRTLISVELLRRIGFADEAERFRRTWTRIYPNPRAGSIPKAILESFPQACALAVDTMCLQPYLSLGNKSLAQVIRFGAKEQQMIEEAARRLAAGTDPGIVPARFLIGAARVAVDARMARPGTVAENFYKELARR
jgi:hypothetical protein